MEAKELRIGNCILKNGSNYIVDTLFFVDVYDGTAMGFDLQPIPLTEEILLKCGFVRHHEDYYNEVILIKDVITKDFTCKLYPKELGSAYEIKNSIKIKYLHQLQNLYFALTNEELTVNL